MILKYQHFDLLDKIVLEYVTFEPPLKADKMMHDEACFIYAVQGASVVYGGTEKHHLQTDEGMLMKCGSYVNNWHRSAETQPYEAIVIHFYPDVLHFVYQNEVPSFLARQGSPSTKLIHKITSEEAIKHYIQGLLFYFENPTLTNEDLVILKVKELVLIRLK